MGVYEQDTYYILYRAIKSHVDLEDEDIRGAGMHGADAGWGGFTYIGDCVEFYENNENRIYELLIDTADQMGCKNVEELIAGFNRSDMLNSPDGRKNLLAWFVLEEVGRWIDNMMENDEWESYKEEIGETTE